MPPSDPAVELLEPSTPPQPSPRFSNPFGLGFRAPSNPPPDPTPSPESSPQASTLEEFEDEPASVDESDASDLESLEDIPSPASSRASDAEAVKVEILSEAELQAIARGGVAAAGVKAHDLFATTEGQQTVGLYLTDEVDQATIGDPLASIAARRQGAVGKVNPDTKDLLSALVGLFGYATKQINRRTEAKALDSGARPPQPLPEAVDL